MIIVILAVLLILLVGVAMGSSHEAKRWGFPLGEFLGATCVILMASALLMIPLSYIGTDYNSKAVPVTHNLKALEIEDKEVSSARGYYLLIGGAFEANSDSKLKATIIEEVRKGKYKMKRFDPTNVVITETGDKPTITRYVQRNAPERSTGILWSVYPIPSAPGIDLPDTEINVPKGTILNKFNVNGEK